MKMIVDQFWDEKKNQGRDLIVRQRIKALSKTDDINIKALSGNRWQK